MMTEARQGSLYERVRVAGLLDETFERVLGGEHHRVIVRWLKSEGIECGQSALYAMIRQHGGAWRYERAREAVAAEELPEDMEEATKAALRKRRLIFALEASSAQELLALERIQQAEKSLALDERKTRVSEKTLEQRIEKDRQSAAEYFLEILQEGDTLERMRAAVNAADTTAEKLGAIKTLVWGEQAAAPGRGGV